MSARLSLDWVVAPRRLLVHAAVPAGPLGVQRGRRDGTRQVRSAGLLLTYLR